MYRWIALTMMAFFASTATAGTPMTSPASNGNLSACMSIRLDATHLLRLAIAFRPDDGWNLSLGVFDPGQVPPGCDG